MRLRRQVRPLPHPMAASATHVVSMATSTAHAVSSEPSIPDDRAAHTALDSHGEPLLHVVHEDANMLVVNKPAGLVCHPTKGDAFSSLISRVRMHLGADFTPTLINRLDRETSGMVILSKNIDTDRALKRFFEDRAVTKVGCMSFCLVKEYVALVHGHVAGNRVECSAPLGVQDDALISFKRCVRPDGSPAMTVVDVLQRITRAEGQFTLVQVRPQTGRQHQIRVHLAHLGHPIVGDKLYGGDEQLYLDFAKFRLTPEQQARLIFRCHALHANRIAFEWKGHAYDFSAPPETWFADFAVTERPVKWEWAQKYL